MTSGIALDLAPSNQPVLLTVDIPNSELYIIVIAIFNGARNGSCHSFLVIGMNDLDKPFNG